MKKNSYIKLKFIAFILCMVGAAYAGYEAGGYWHTQKMERLALAHDCASLDPKTLAFGWKLPISMDIAMDALPDVAPSRKPYKAGAK